LNNDGNTNSAENDNEDDNSVDTSMKGVPNSQLGLYQAIQNKQVTLVNSGCWMVIGTDGTTSYVVRLFPKETCSCPAASVCFHILACKIMIGQESQTQT